MNKNKFIPVFMLVGLLLILLSIIAIIWLVIILQPNVTDPPKNSQFSQFDEIEEVNVTKDELLEKDGREGNLCWVAIDGIVYEISGFALWVDGLHTSSGGKARCGKDLSGVINESPHGKSKLKLLKEVGILIQ